MLESCNHSMRHFEHMCSITEDSCAIETVRFEGDYECIPCHDASHRHYELCTPNIIGT